MRGRGMLGEVLRSGICLVTLSPSEVHSVRPFLLRLTGCNLVLRPKFIAFTYRSNLSLTTYVLTQSTLFFSTGFPHYGYFVL